MALFMRRDGSRGAGGRFAIAGIIAAISLITYFANTSVNPLTGKKQHISLSTQDEIALGLQAAPEMARQFGGLDSERQAQDLIDRVGMTLVGSLPEEAHDYPYEFHLLSDSKTVNAFALPGGPIFITRALFDRLQTEGQLAGVLGHEIGHVVGRHSAERMAKAQLAQGLVTATGVGASDDPRSAQAAAAMASTVAQFALMSYGREDELESDRLGVRFMVAAGYDPRSMIEVMRILEQASGGSSQPEFASTHPNPGRRVEKIEEAIRAEFPNGVPAGLKK